MMCFCSPGIVKLLIEVPEQLSHRKRGRAYHVHEGHARDQVGFVHLQAMLSDAGSAVVIQSYHALRVRDHRGIGQRKLWIS